MHNPFDPGYYGSEELRGFGFAAVGDNVQIAKNCTIIGLHNISLGDHVRVDGFCTIVAGAGHLNLGRYVHIHTSVVLGCRGGLDIGDYSGVSHGCQILTASDDFSGRWMTNSNLPAGCTNPKIAPIVIGKHVPVGAGCTITPGVTIGDGAAVLAHSVVSRDLPEWMMCGGTPAIARVPRRRRVMTLAPTEGMEAAA